MLTTLLFALEIKFVLKIASNAGGISRTLYYKKKQRSLDCALFYCKALRKQLEHSRSGKKHKT